MQEMGLEPTRGRPRQILSLMRLPFRHSCANVLILRAFFNRVRLLCFTPRQTPYFFESDTSARGILALKNKNVNRKRC